MILKYALLFVVVYGIYRISKRPRIQPGSNQEKEESGDYIEID